MDPTSTLTPNRAEAERSLAIAAKLLTARDLVGSKRFAELALDADPRLSDDRADQILAIADVLLASQKRVNNHHDWYSILQLPHPSAPSPVSALPSPDYLLKRHYRRLTLLLHPDRNRSPGADSAFKLVVDAYGVLSDPTKRSLFDAELTISQNLPSDSSAAAPSFWTLCPSCRHAHQYPRVHIGKTLRCQICRRAFAATELQSPPPIVPGTDMYYASWGFFPLGFSAPVGPDWKPFVPMNPPGEQNPQAPAPPQGNNGNGPVGRNKKKMARKKVMSSGVKNWNFAAGTEVVEERREEVRAEVRAEEVRGININEAAKGSEDGGGVRTDDYEMVIDLDVTDDMLGNLHNLPFLKDDGIKYPYSVGSGSGFRPWQ